MSGTGHCLPRGYPGLSTDSRSMGIPTLQLVITAEAEVIPAEQVQAEQAEAEQVEDGEQ